MEPRTTTYHVPSQLIPVSGWHAAYHDAHGSRMVPVYFLAIAQRHEIRMIGQGHTLPGRRPTPEEWAIVGLTYARDTATWVICEDQEGFISLLPPIPHEES